MILIIGITGATGVIYGIRLLEVLSAIDDVETHLILSEASRQIIKYETDKKVEEIEKLADEELISKVRCCALKLLYFVGFQIGLSHASP